MCDHCGCDDGKAAAYFAGGKAEHTHTRADGTAYTHAHPAAPGAGDAPGTHGHPHGPRGPTRTLTLEQKVLARNDAVAAANRAWLDERGIVALNLISAPGSGKTLLLERTLERLRDRVPCAVIAGDQQTDHDARRLLGKGAPVCQIETHAACHLDAGRIAEVLPTVAGAGAKLLFIENVGNMVCPAAFDLGEHFKVALLSVTEGEDKPEKYPVLFAEAAVAVLTKTDLVPHLEWDAAACRRSLQRVHPGIFLFELSARTGDGLDAWAGYLARLAG